MSKHKKLTARVGIFLAALFGAQISLAAETAANSTVAGGKQHPSVAIRSDATGGSVFAWTAGNADGASNGIVARVFNSVGAPLTSEIGVNSPATGVVGNQVQPRVALDGAGNFAVVWSGPDGSDSGIFVNRFLADGTPVSFAEARVNAPGTGARSAPAIAMASDGRFVVAWESDQTGTFQVYARWYDATGTAVGPEAMLTSTDANAQASVGMKPDGETVLAWTRLTGGQKDIFVRRYDAVGSALTVEIPTNTTTAGEQEDPAVGVSTTGEALVVWKGVGTGTDIFAQRFASNGQKRLTEFLVNGTTAGNQISPSVSLSANGDAVVAWRTDAGLGDVAYRRFRADGTAVSAQALANTTTAGDQYQPSVALTQEQRPKFVIAYGSDGVSSDDNVLFDTFAFGDSTTVLSPSLSTENWSDGISQTMKWGFTLAAASPLPTFTLQLDRDGNFSGGACTTETISTGVAVGATATTAVFSYVVPPPPGGCVAPWPVAKVRAIASNSSQDDSVPFVVTAAPQLTVMRPLQGALAPSVSSEIRWSHNMGAPTVNIDLSRNGGGAPANYVENITTNAPSSATTRGAFYWLPAGVCDSILRCRIKVCWTADLTVCAESDPFNIATCPAITVNPATVPDGTPSVAYGPVALTQAGGVGTGTWNVSAGALPTGMSLSSGGSLGGTPTATGTFNFTARVLDDNLCAGTRPYTFKVCPAITVNPATAPDGTLGAAYSQTFTATGGAGHTFAVSAGALPGGLTLSSGGALTGTPNASGTFNFTVEATATGGCKGSRAYTVIIRARPVISNVGTVLAYTENQSGTAIESALVLTDADSANIQSATVQITANYVNGQDVLACSSCGGITQLFTLASGTLTLTGPAPIGAFQAALRSVTYTNSSENPSTLPRTITWIATDPDTNSSVPVTSTINITAVNDAPSLADAGGTFTFTEGDAATIIDTTLTVSDVDSTNLTQAAIQITGNYALGDDVLACSNPACTAGGLSVSFAPVTGTLTISGSATLAIYEAALEKVTYFNISQNPTTSLRTVSWQLNDGAGANNLSAIVTSTITVANVNDKPIVVGKVTTVQANMKRTGIDVFLLASTDDLDNGVNGCFTTLSVASITSGTGGTVSGVNLSAGTFDFDPAPGFTGLATAFYTVSDNGCGPIASETSNTGTININVSGPVIWFVNAAVAGPGDGRLSNPFKTLASADAVDGPNHAIFLYSGAYTITSFQMNASETLLGQGLSTAGFDSILGIAPPAGTISRPQTKFDNASLTRPAVTAAGAIGVTLSNSAKVLGLNVTNANGHGIFSNSGGAISLTDFNITATNGTALWLTASGSVTAAGADNTLTSTNGVALNVNTVSIGAAGLTFKSISASGATNGIVLNNTGGNGLTVTGTGTTGGSGGTIQNTSNRGASFISANNITLSNMNFTNVGTTNLVNPQGGGGPLPADDNGTVDPANDPNFNLNVNAGIHLVNVTGVTLTNIQMSGGAQHGINGNNVTNFVLTNSSVRGFGNEVREHGLQFKDMLGTSSITNTTFGGSTAATNNAANQMHIENYTGAVGTTITLDGVNVQSRGYAATGVTWSHGLLFNTHNTANADVVIKNSTFNNLFSNSIQAANDGNAVLEVKINNNVFTNVGASAINVVQQNNNVPGQPGTVRFNIFDNGTAAAPTFLRGINTGVSHSININQADDGLHTTGGVLEGAITNNFIGDTSSVNSASTGGVGIKIGTISPGTLTAQVNGNTIRGTQGGIQADLGEDSNAAHTMNLRIFSNTVVITDPNAFDGIRVNSGTLGGDQGVVRLDLHDNSAGTVAASNDFNIRPRRANIQLLNYTGGSNDDAAVITYLDVTRNNNPTGAGSDWFVTPQGPGSFGNTVSVPAPTLPSPLMFAPGGVERSPGVAMGQPVGPSAESLTQSQLDAVVAEAMLRWEASGLTPAQSALLRDIRVVIADLGADGLAQTTTDRIRVDGKAAANGWFIDLEDGDGLFEAEVSATRRYTQPTAAAAGRVDLLSAVMHEMGHAIGLADTYADADRDDLMYGYLTNGERRVPRPGQASLNKLVSKP